MNNELKQALRILQGYEEEFNTPEGPVVIEDYEKVYDFMIENKIDNLLMPDFGDAIEDTVGDELATWDDKFDYSKIDGFKKVSD